MSKEQIDINGAQPASTKQPTQATAEVQDVVGNRVNQTSQSIDYSKLLEQLSHCENLPQLFEQLRKGVNEILESNPVFAAKLNDFAQDPIGKEKIHEAVCNNDFGSLNFPKDTNEFGRALDLASIKNQMIAEVTRKAIETEGGRLGLKKAEKEIILGYLKMTSSIDSIYMAWRTGLYPRTLLTKFEDPDELKGFLEKNGLDDPYAVVKENPDGIYSSVPYSAAFPVDSDRFIKTVDEMIANLENVPDNAKILEYLKAYKKALSCKESKKEPDGEYTSVKLWKDVDEKWVPCQGRIQVLHGIETGYEESVDPAQIKVIPEIKLVIKVTDAPKDELIKRMKGDLPETLKKILGENSKAVKTLNPVKTSHVASINVITAGGASMDYLGLAQMAPNYPDVQQKAGIKAYVDKVDTEAPLMEKIIERVVGKDNYTDEWNLKPGEDEDQYFAQFIGGHEVGHVFLADDVDKLEEVKATWTGMVYLYNAEKQGKLPKGTAKNAMIGHIKFCLKYLMKTKNKVDDYGIEGLVNIKLFFQKGLIKDTPEGFKFDFSKIDEVYNEIEKQWKTFAELYMAEGREEEGTEANRKYTEWRDKLIAEEEYKGSMDKLRDLALEGSRG